MSLGTLEPTFLQPTRRVLAVYLLLALAASHAMAVESGRHAEEAAVDLVVRTRDGLVRGIEGRGVREWRGIPFAAPPVGDLRFAPPAPALPWAGVRDGGRMGEACPQARRFNLTEASDAEDCLHLNVAVPTAPSQSPRPVLVWFYGGAFVGGSTRLYGIDYLAREGDLVVVSVNYRLGPFGFMAHPAFGDDFNGGYAFEDQRAALRWVQANIAAFGGDPSNVTIGGVSAGAASVCMHLIAPERTTGLFHKAIVQSAGCARTMRTLDEAKQAGRDFARFVGCGDDANTLACLRRKPVKELVDAGTAAAAANPLAFWPVMGTKAVPQQAPDAFAAGEFVRVPILNGGTTQEMRLYVGYQVAAGEKITAENYVERLRALYGDNAATVAKAYPVERFSSPPAALGTVMSDFMQMGGLNNCTFLRMAWLTSRWTPVYQYEFADPAAPPVMPDPGFEMGAVHTAELPYQFPGFSNTSIHDGPALAPASQELAGQMARYWSAFAHHGRPEATGLPTWETFNASRQAMRLEPGKLGMFDAGSAHQCALWERLYPAALSR